MGGTGQRRFGGASLKPHKLPENAATPTSRVHALLGGVLEHQTPRLKKDSIAKLTTLLHTALPISTDKHHNLMKREIFKDSTLTTNRHCDGNDLKHENPDEPKTRLEEKESTILPVTEPYQTKQLWRRGNMGCGEYKLCATSADEPET